MNGFAKIPDEHSLATTQTRSSAIFADVGWRLAVTLRKNPIEIKVGEATPRKAIAATNWSTESESSDVTEPYPGKGVLRCAW
jgi:hypothetical protein